MYQKNLGISIVAVTLLASVGSAFAWEPPPAQNISAERHPNLANAQALLRQAYDAISAAQRANQEQLGGHADRAKALIDQASAELKAAAVTANAEGR
ncbi:hypothetical protein [Burkholderia pseudomallei]|uniref:hypothetical protein n=1 Tax=Burkholderia pseudomallei TaxID=28450 RepID=UPI0009774180|nr:hypothetical protein [Burkholderia pseudomallei]MBM5588881.1 hypothetical protein [Burkholderia pseudomallei]MBM5621924.1 hypothetical protein [Burkholderia pseudomallei]MBM5631837.1 hypothetical protein [Burkholderia pseudomallei]MBM5660688.1 hypothetical protein [Burkholderia pseudomallei]